MMRRTVTTLLVLLLVGIAGLSCFLLLKKQPKLGRLSILPGPFHLKRPYGMAPVAFDAFVRACHQAKVNPNRITQTIGEHPRSVGYHKRDGEVTVRGVKYDYTAATDIHVSGLSERQIARLLQELSKQGFACWYRHGGSWTLNEHIHAVYALLPMKPQLRRQVKQFLRERREAGLSPLKWQKKLRRRRLYAGNI